MPQAEGENIAFSFPALRNGKNPNVYNYIVRERALYIEKVRGVEIKGELYEFQLENKYHHDHIQNVNGEN